MSQARIGALPVWKNDIRIEPLEGGLTNVNCKVVDGDAVYAVRSGEDDRRLGISRQNELACTRFAASLGLAPAIVHAERGLTVAEFVEGGSLEMPASMPEAGLAIARLAATLRRVHGAGARLTGHLRYFSVFQVARTYVADARAHALSIPGGDADGLLEYVAELEREIGPFRPTFCHNDLMPGNILDAGRLWLIDWEYAGVGHRLFDLGGLSNNYGFDADQDAALLSAYFGDPGPEVLREFLIMKAMAALRESLWAVVHGSKSEIDFDYDGYRDENYAKFLRALTTVS